MKNKIKEGVILEGQILFMANGSARVDDIFIYKKNTKNSLHLDNVKIETFVNDNKIEGRVIEVTQRFKNIFVGKAIVSDKHIFVKPDNNKIVVDFYIKGGLIPENNQKVVIELIKWENNKSPKAKIIEILGESGDNDTEMNAIMIEYGLPTEFPLMVEAEAELIDEIITEEEISKRRDFRNIKTIVIDPSDSKDADDSLSVNFIDNNIEVGVHIADVSHYIKEGTELDKEAYNRATSIYLVDRVIPMLPEKLSNGICSLNTKVDRLTFSVVFTFNKNYQIINTWFGKGVINSNKKMSYEEAQTVIETKEGEYKEEILILDKIAKHFRSKRMKEGSIEMGGIEVKFDLDEVTKKPIGLKFKEQKDSNKLIEEFMLLANRTVSRFVKSKMGFCINRVHPKPSMEKLMELKNICDKFGYDFDITEDNIKKSINNLISMIKGTPEQNMIETLIIRTQSKAYYSIDDIGHYGLGFGTLSDNDGYSHFTSPIRRYPDLILHRILNSILNFILNS